MSRLYIWITNELGQEKTLEANASYVIQVNYGSKKDSKKACRITVTWLSNKDKPEILVEPVDCSLHA